MLFVIFLNKISLVVMNETRTVNLALSLCWGDLRLHQCNF